MLEIIIETLVDSIKLLPFLFFAYIIMEYIEHKISNKNREIIKKSGKIGPLIGSIVGVVPQCGFSVAASNLYAARIISLGTLISIYLSTSDEMLPILISQKVDFKIILSILSIKVFIGILCGFFIDYLIRNKKNKNDNIIHDICENEHCNCEKSILKSSIKHTLHIFLFIVIISFVLNIVMYYLGEDILSKLFMKDSLFGPMISSLIALIPNCASSVVITQLYLTGAITFGSVIAGLLSASGVGIAILFKVNKNIKENMIILFSIYFIGVISGIIIDLFKIVI
jgi:hypothetical protein